MNLNCFVSGRTPILYPFIRWAVQLTVATVGTSHCYQLQTQSYQHSEKVKFIRGRDHLGPTCGFRPSKMKYWLDTLHLSDTREKWEYNEAVFTISGQHYDSITRQALYYLCEERQQTKILGFTKRKPEKRTTAFIISAIHNFPVLCHVAFLHLPFVTIICKKPINWKKK